MIIAIYELMWSTMRQEIYEAIKDARKAKGLTKEEVLPEVDFDQFYETALGSFEEKRCQAFEKITEKKVSWSEAKRSMKVPFVVSLAGQASSELDELFKQSGIRHGVLVY